MNNPGYNIIPKYKRYKTKYPGIYYIKGTSVFNGKPENIYYIVYRRDNKKHEERVGRQYQDDMTPARASLIRAEKIKGTALPNKHARELSEHSGKVDLNYLFDEFFNHKKHLKSLSDDICRYNKHVRYVLGDKEITEIKPTVHKLKDNLLKSLNPQTVKHVLTLINV